MKHLRIESLAFVLFFIAFLCPFLAGCSRPAESDPAPLLFTMVCPEGEAGKTSGERLVLFEEWCREAMERPGSTYQVITSGRDRDSWRPRLVIRVPEGWGANALASKASFLEYARSKASESALPETLVTIPAGAVAPGAGGGPERVVVAGSDTVYAGSVRHPRPAPVATAATSIHEAVVCDRSDSGLDFSCTPESVTGFFDLWLSEASPLPGSTFTVYLAGSSRDDVKRLFEVTVPRLSAGAATAHLLGAREEAARSIAQTRENPNASAIVEAIHVAAESLNERGGRRGLHVLSDLRQVTPRQWNFERSVPAPGTFVGDLARAALLPDLRATAVTACGIHHRRLANAPPFDARQEESLRTTWEAAFRAMGVKELHMYSDCKSALSAGEVVP